MQWIKASHPGLQKIPVPPGGHPSCEAILVDMGDDKAAQHKEHIHGQVALVHGSGIAFGVNGWDVPAKVKYYDPERGDAARSEEHTSELQSRLHLVCRLLLEKK